MTPRRSRIPTGIVITEAAANKYFSSTDVLGEVITLDNQYDFHVTAIIRDLPLNSHFNSLPIMEGAMDVIAPFKALKRLRDFDETGDWNNLSLGNMTYVMLPPALDGVWLQTQMDEFYDRHVPEPQQEIAAEILDQPAKRRKPGTLGRAWIADHRGYKFTEFSRARGWLR